MASSGGTVPYRARRFGRYEDGGPGYVEHEECPMCIEAGVEEAWWE